MPCSPTLEAVASRIRTAGGTDHAPRDARICAGCHPIANDVHFVLVLGRSLPYTTAECMGRDPLHYQRTYAVQCNATLCGTCKVTAGIGVARMAGSVEQLLQLYSPWSALIGSWLSCGNPEMRRLTCAP